MKNDESCTVRIHLEFFSVKLLHANVMFVGQVYTILRTVLHGKKSINYFLNMNKF